MTTKQEAQAREALAAGFKWAPGMWAYWPSDADVSPKLRGYRWLVLEVAEDGEPYVVFDVAHPKGRWCLWGQPGAAGMLLPCLDDAGTKGHLREAARIAQKADHIGIGGGERNPYNPDGHCWIIVHYNQVYRCEGMGPADKFFARQTEVDGLIAALKDAQYWAKHRSQA